MSNPFRKHVSNLFGSRGCDIDNALNDANEIVQALPVESRAHAMTALMLLVNTAAGAFDQAQGPSPEKLAILDLIRTEMDNWASSHLDTHIEGWIDNNLDNHLDNWASNQLDIDHSIEEWMSTNIEEKVSEAIDNLDLVVRVR
jgi:hypothetical protein